MSILSQQATNSAARMEALQKHSKSSPVQPMLYVRFLLISPLLHSKFPTSLQLQRTVHPNTWRTLLEPMLKPGTQDHLQLALSAPTMNHFSDKTQEHY